MAALLAITLLGAFSFVRNTDFKENKIVDRYMY